MNDYKFMIFSGNGVNNTHRIEVDELCNAERAYKEELQWSLNNVSMIPLSAKNWENPNYEPEEYDLFRVELIKVDMDGDFIEVIKASEEYYLEH